VPEPGDVEPRVVSYSEIAAARHCPLRHQLAYVERWHQEGEQRSGARGLGTDWHFVLEAQFRELMAIQALMRDQGQAPEPHPWARWTYPDGTAETLYRVIHDTDVFAGPNAELIAWMYEGYTRYYQLHPTWTILAVEFNPEVELPNPDGGPSRFRLKVRADLVVQDLASQLIWLIDHKSGQRRPIQEALDLSDQFGLYTWCLRLLGRPVHGAIHSWAKTVRPKTSVDTLANRFQLYPLDRGEHELAEIAADAYRSIDRRYQEVDAEMVPTSAPDGEWCKRRCDFVNPHLAARKGFTTLQAYLRDTGWSPNAPRH
jgi:hypothetical protein